VPESLSDDLARIQAGPPTPAAQRALLLRTAAALEPLRVAHNLPPFAVAPGLRLTRLWGRCDRPVAGGAGHILVRCTADPARTTWRRSGAIVLTLLHEMAHLRWRGHGRRFWDLHRRLVNAAAAQSLYLPHEDDAAEASRGDEKLAGTAAEAIAGAARARRLARAAANRAAARSWAVGDTAMVATTRGRLAGTWVRVTAVGRGRVTVIAPDSRAYLVSAVALSRGVAAETAAGAARR
jgi:hypothetical protein